MESKGWLNLAGWGHVPLARGTTPYPLSRSPSTFLSSQQIRISKANNRILRFGVRRLTYEIFREIFGLSWEREYLPPPFPWTPIVSPRCSLILSSKERHALSNVAWNCILESLRAYGRSYIVIKLLPLLSPISDVTWIMPRLFSGSPS